MSDVWDQPETLAEKIRVARKLAGWSQGRLAEEAGTSPNTVKRWEAGDPATLGRTPNARRAVAIVVGHLTDQMHLLGLVDEPADLAGRVQVLEHELEKLRERGGERVHIDDLGIEDDLSEAEGAAGEIERSEIELDDDDDEEPGHMSQRSA